MGPTTTEPTPLPAPDHVVGLYALRASLESACPGVPEVARNRTYTARFALTRENSYVVTLSDATFFVDEPLPGGGAIIHCGHRLGCNQFVASGDGDMLRFQLAPTPINDDDDEFFTGGGTIVERIPPDGRLQISGTGIGSLDGPRIEASLQGDVNYCRTASAPAYSVSNCVYCPSANLQLTFVRK